MVGEEEAEEEDSSSQESAGARLDLELAGVVGDNVRFLRDEPSLFAFEVVPAMPFELRDGDTSWENEGEDLSIGSEADFWKE